MNWHFWLDAAGWAFVLELAAVLGKLIWAGFTHTKLYARWYLGIWIGNGPDRYWKG